MNVYFQNKWYSVDRLTLYLPTNLTWTYFEIISLLFVLVCVEFNFIWFSPVKVPKNKLFREEAQKWVLMSMKYEFQKKF